MKMKRVFGALTAASCALFAASAFGAAENVVSNDFESVAANAAISTVSGWFGYGTVTNDSYTYSESVGRPTAGNHTKVLAVEGQVICSNDTMVASKPTTLDMMVQIALPDDALAFPEDVDSSEVHIAVGVATNGSSTTAGYLQVYCKNKAGAPGWYDLGLSPYSEGDWHRVSLTFDYEHGLCQVRVDGEPAMTANGYLTADTSTQSGVNGSWYKLATGTTYSKFESVQVIGSTSIDDFLVKQDTSEDATVYDVLPELADKGGATPGAGGIMISNAWIEAQGITRDQAAGLALDDSGMTVSQKYVAGYEVADGKKFGVKEMTMTNSVATITFDAAAVKPGYKYAVYTKTGSGDWTDSGTVVDATTGAASIDLDGSAVKYLKLKVVTEE